MTIKQLNKIHYQLSKEADRLETIEEKRYLTQWEARKLNHLCNAISWIDELSVDYTSEPIKQ